MSSDHDPAPLCESVQAQFPEHLNEELEDTARHAFEAHLERCARCTREFAHYRELFSVLERDRHVASESVAAARIQLNRALAHNSTASAPLARRLSPLAPHIAKAAAFVAMLWILAPVSERWSSSFAGGPVESSELLATDLMGSLLDRARSATAEFEEWRNRVSLQEWMKIAPESSREALDPVPAFPLRAAPEKNQ